jgi:type I restriction-modification system DNA methylase subunit
MASLAKSYSQEKLFGQVYTPQFIVCKILDDVGYNSPEILGKTIIDPACGDGRFLVEIVKRIVDFSEEDIRLMRVKFISELGN